ncbi:MAG TPA: FtsQ-type POTRA domain-containing protein [Alphaproteobacteria bacterium]|nr:FtsQ-type POTRA domain-containing protein [Alphaproteobacteria bacterium]
MGTVFRFPARSALVGLAVLWLFAWLTLSDPIGRLSTSVRQDLLVRSAHHGFAVRNILIEGRENTDPGELKEVVGLSWGDPIFGFDTGDLRARVEALSWVRRARVERRLPDTVFIRLEERIPLALWQIDGGLRLIDEGGAILTAQNLGRFQSLPLVVGPGAHETAREILSLVEAEPVLRNRVAAFVRVGQRRWDLKLTNGLVLKLPERGMELALRRAAQSQSREGIFDRGLVAVDLREPDRMILRTTPPPEDTQTLARKEP